MFKKEKNSPLELLKSKKKKEKIKIDNKPKKKLTPKKYMHFPLDYFFFKVSSIKALKRNKFLIKTATTIKNILWSRKVLLFNNAIKYKNNNFVAIKVSNALHSYTGYKNITIFGKSLQKYKDFLLNFYSKNLYNSVWSKLRNFPENTIALKLPLTLEQFLKKFPFFYLKIYKNLLHDLYYYYSLPYQDFNNRYQLLKDSFNVFYESMDGHFFRAFKNYKILINKLFKHKFLNVEGIKIIFKGRFGKVRKQIQNFVVGSLSLNCIFQEIIYYKSLLVTQRGSYGFHIWFAKKKGYSPKLAGKLIKNI